MVPTLGASAPPPSISTPPIPAMSTYWRFPRKFMTGPMTEPHTRALTELSRSSPLSSRNTESAGRWRL